tara:strand:+ start:14538 stop:15464 length:927 start_codon:yes stop_codon:yes gene_type:complete
MEQIEKYTKKINEMGSGYDGKMIETLLSNKPYIISRLGQVEYNACHGEHLPKFPSKELIQTRNSIDQYCRNNAGFYFKNPSEVDGKVLKERDIFFIFQNKYLNAMFESDKVLVYRVHLDGFFRLYKSVLDDLPWTEYYEELDLHLILLEYYTRVLDKKVLIVSNFEETIKKQLKIYDKIFPQYNVKTENIVVYKSYQTIRGNTPHDNWFETYKVMENDISKLDFDYAFLGCGCYGLPLSNFIHKEMKKSAFYVGATIQLMMGITGLRWEGRRRHDKYWLWKYTNEHWVRPSENERPKNYEQVEEGCYW